MGLGKVPPCGSINFFSCVLLVSLFFLVFRIVEMLMRHFAYISMPSCWPAVARVLQGVGSAACTVLASSAACGTKLAFTL